MSLAVVLLANVGLERAVGGPLELPQLTGEGRITHLVGSSTVASRCWVVRSRPFPPVRLVARVTPALDGGSSIVISLLPKNLTLVAVGSRVGRCYEDIITSVVAMDRHPRWPVWRRGVHRGRIATGPSSAGMRWLDGAMAYRSRRPQLIVR